MVIKIVVKKKAVPAPAPLVEKAPPVRKPWDRKPPGRLLDGECRYVIAQGPNGVVSWWLMAAYAYEALSRPIVSDAMFDEMGQIIDRTWDDITHPHKALLNRASLKTALGIEIPLTARYGVRSLIRDVWGETVDVT